MSRQPSTAGRARAARRDACAPPLCARLRAATTALLALLLVGLTACDDQPVASPEATALPEARTTVAGDWWVLAPALPTHALRLTLVRRADDPDRAWDGSWRSFDWRGTERPHLLARGSHPVAVSARRNLSGQLEVHGPVPQIDAQGRPTGQEGACHLVVEQVSLAGQPLRFAGTLTRDGQPAVPVELTTAFRTWGS